MDTTQYREMILRSTLLAHAVMSMLLLILAITAKLDYEPPSDARERKRVVTFTLLGWFIGLVCISIIYKELTP